MGFWKNLSEALKSPFYSDIETKRVEYDKKYSSASTPEVYQSEPDVVLSDLSYSYTFGLPIDHILANRNALINQWRDVQRIPEVDEAIEEIVDEALVFEETDELPIQLDLDDLDVTDNLKNKIHKSFEKILNLLEFNDSGADLFRQWYVDGVLNLEVVYNNKHMTNGIKRLILLPPYDFYKIKYPETGQVEFFFNPRISDYYRRGNSMMTLQNMHEDAEIRYAPEQITQITSGRISTDRTFSISYLHKCLKVVNQLSLIEDSIVISRVTRAPEKKVFYIDTGRLPKAKAEAYIQNLMNKHRNQMSYNYETGAVENRKKSVSLLEDFWIPRSADGKGTQIDTIGGGDALTEKIEDLEWFYHKLYRALDVPSNRREKESPFTAVTANNLDVEREEIKFFKSVIKKRKQFNKLFYDLLKKDMLASKTFTYSDWDKVSKQIKIKYKNNNDYAHAKFLANLESKMSIAETALAMAEEYKMFSKDWVFRNVMNFTDDQIRVMKQEVEQDGPVGDGIPNEDMGDEEF